MTTPDANALGSEPVSDGVLRLLADADWLRGAEMTDALLAAVTDTASELLASRRVMARLLAGEAKP